MEDFHKIYHNSFGASIQWKRSIKEHFNKVQIVFKNTGLYMTHEEIQLFSSYIDEAMSSAVNSILVENLDQEKKSLYPVETPFSQLCFAMTLAEVKGLQDLIKGTLFNLNYTSLIKDVLSDKK